MLLLLLVPPVLLLLCGLVLIWVPLPPPFPPAATGARNQMAAVATGILGLTYLVGLTVYLVSLAQGAARTLDTLLLPAGLSSKRHLVVGRRYRGMIQGRGVGVTFLPGYGITPALLNVTFDADLDTRMAVGKRRPRLDCTDCTRVDVDGPGLGELCIVAEDVGAAHRLLRNPEASAALVNLLTGGDSGVREVYVQPQQVWLRARPRGVTVGAVAQSLDELETLADVAEVLLGPHER